jgi:predicted dehydrogenase
MDEEPRSVVAAQAGMRNSNLSDIAYADYQFSSGRSAHLEVCWLDPDKSARLDVFGETGVLSIDDSRHGSSLAVKPFSVSRNAQGKPSVSRGDERPIAFDDEEPLKAEIGAFIDAVTTGKTFETSAQRGVAVLRALAMADDAARSRSEQNVLA